VDKPEFTVPYERLPECMTLRDYFAGQIAQGFIRQEFITSTYKQIADACYEMADAMLEARKQDV